MDDHNEVVLRDERTELDHWTERRARPSDGVIEVHHHHTITGREPSPGEDLLRRLAPYFVIMTGCIVMFGMIAGILMMIVPPFLAIILALVSSFVSIIMSLVAVMFAAVLMAMVIGYLTKVNSTDARKIAKRRR